MTLALYDLRCEFLSQPIGIQSSSPRLSWKLESDQRETQQTAYRIEVARSAAHLAAKEADLWDSGKVSSDTSHLVPYDGASLTSRHIAYWRVTVWDNHGQHATSEISSWEMGLLDASDWSASWINAAKLPPSQDPIVLDWCEKVVYRPTTDGGYERERKLDEIAIEKRVERIQTVESAQPAAWLRRRFSISKPVHKARLYAANLGYAELHLNGYKLNDRVLDPAQTDYELRALYTIDILDDRLHEGEHELRIHLAEGWYGQSHGFFDTHFRYGKPLALAQLEIEYCDGTRETIVTDSHWQAASSQVLKANLYTGEVYDARITESDLQWGPVAGPDSEQPLPQRLEAQLLPPTRKVDRLAPKSIIETTPGTYVVDMGINFAGWVSLALEAPRGAVVDLTYSEILTPENKLDWDTMGRRAVGAYQWDRYITNGQGRETYEPRFTYHGFQYIEIVGLPQKPELDDIVGYQVRTDFKRTGSFECSDSFLNKLHETILWTYEANFVGLPADCPHREKCGWLDAYNTAEMVYHNWDIGPSIGKYIEDIRSSSELLGGLPGNIAPGRRNGMFEAFDWGICTILLPWWKYHYTGDLRIVEEHWDHMLRYLDFAHEKYPSGIPTGSLGDWCDQPATLELSFTRVDGSPFNSHPATTAAMHYYFAVKSMAMLARKLDKSPRLVDTFEKRAERIRQTINATYFHARAMTFGSQAENALALIYGVVDPENRQAVADRLAEEIVHGNDGHFNVGAHGAGFLYHALSNYGHADVAWRMFEKETYPSYRYMFSQGATTIWENMSRWDPIKITTSKSLSHPFQSSFHHWFYNAIGGVQTDPSEVGFKKLIFMPQAVGLLDSASASIETPYGKARSSWRIAEQAFSWKIEVPANTSATLVIPNAIVEVTLDQQPIERAERKVLGTHYPQTLELGSGNYQIEGRIHAAPTVQSVTHRLNLS
ncbi:family 78 glycoside hydrolase catalytic domain [Pelagicoccus sp. SDUM812005]|uniref:family 78 glycoside hydrolase catalytic domain n=1 Tax=Pelagicoccus sp. SDUM812005 TaxID=3041257 RepID=UPI00280E8DFC|nr:family 78 glycoside hydrolase catalytic domain [Pelagicoccus sp. SDUM812005]MDQ8183141.1 family 78 glycoside hydrolase catalytic domain [Pelagicoccus sp. SDUM812005]